MNVAWNLVAGTATRYLLQAVNVSLSIFLMPYTAGLLGIARVTRRVAVPPQSIAAVVLEGAAVGAAHLIAVWLLGFDRAVRTRYLTYARRVFVSFVATPASLRRRPGATPATI